MKKVLFCSTDLLYKRFDGYDPISSKENRDKFLDYANRLCSNEENLVCFVSRDPKKLSEIKKYYEEHGFTNFRFKRRDEIKAFVEQNKSRTNCFVFISGKEVDFHVAVNCKALFIVPTWIPTEDKADYYGVHVDSPEQLAQFIKTLNNHNAMYATLNIEPHVTLYSLVDARYKAYSDTNAEKEMLMHFEQLLKSGTSRNYYSILMYHFLAGMTRTTFLDDIELFGMIPSSDCTVNPDMFSFMTQTRLIKGKQLPRRTLYKQSAKYQNLLIRHTPKPRAHLKYNFQQRANMGCNDEFSSLCINSQFKDKIENLKKVGKFNVCIFDDYTTFGNSFNAVRNLLNSLGVNKLVFISLGSFVRDFQKKDYNIIGDVYSPNYQAILTNSSSLHITQINPDAKAEVDNLYNIFNS